MKFVKMGEHAVLPERGSEEAAGYDISSAEEVLLCSGQRHMFSTHIGVELEAGTEAILKPRSKLANKFGIVVLAGEIDSDYEGEVKVILLNTGDKPLHVEIGDKIVQMRHQYVIQTEPEWVERSKATARGSKGIDCKDLRL